MDNAILPNEPFTNFIVEQRSPYIVYVKISENGYITAVNSSAFLTDVTGWAEIDSGYGDKYHHAQSNYFSKVIFTENGAYCYKLVSGKPIECTLEEITEQEEANQSKDEHTAQDDTDAMLVDHEYRLTMLELGLTE